MGKRILLTTFGSFGDLHPYIALALGLRARGHRVTIATCDIYQEKVEGEGIGFHAIRPSMREMDATPEIMRLVMDPVKGPQHVAQELVAPNVRDQYADLEPTVREADLVVSHVLTFAAPLLCRQHGIPWAASILQPMVFASAYEPPVPPNAPGLAALYRLGPRFNAGLIRAIKRVSRNWVAPVDRLREELGLPDRGHPLFEGQMSPHLNLALFSRVLAEPQPDWPERTLVTGFPFYDRHSAGAGMPPELTAFLDAGPPPVVFTLGSSAVMIGGDFYEQSIEAARRLGRRAVLLAGKEGWNRLPSRLPEGMIACEYAPHGELFPRAAAIVHQGGVGTTGQALRAGRPMLVVPFSHDQPDNAARVVRLRVARTLPRARYTAPRAAAQLRRLLEEPGYTRRAEEVGQVVQAEDGVGAACAALETLLEKFTAETQRAQRAMG